VNGGDLDAGEVEQITDEDRIFIGELVSLSEHPPMGHNRVARKDANFNVGVANVNRKEHGRSFLSGALLVHSKRCYCTTNPRMVRG
jgi:hypothetical protein